MMIKITAKEKPRWYQLRWRLASAIVSLASKIHPQNPDVIAFYMQQVTDLMIYGQAVTRVNPLDILPTDAEWDTADAKKVKDD